MMAKRNTSAAPASPQVRCAIYTRKSSEDGLQLEFNSLDAQREAAEAYVASQRHQNQMVATRNWGLAATNPSHRFATVSAGNWWTLIRTGIC